MDDRLITADDLQKGDKSFRVVFWITEGGSVEVKADSKEEAEKKFHNYLDAYSLDENLRPLFDCSNREWEVLEFDTERL